MFNRHFQENPQIVEKSAQHEVVEQMVIACQKLDLYLNSSPGELQCFITRAEIAKSHEHTPLFEMAKSLADPTLIKHNVTKVAQPLLDCLRSFVDVYK